jgi:hypothetical protein
MNIQKYELELMLKTARSAKFSFQRSAHGGWLLSGTINGKGFFLAKQNGGLRTWKSLDSLVAFLDALGAGVPSLQTEVSL